MSISGAEKNSQSEHTRRPKLPISLLINLIPKYTLLTLKHHTQTTPMLTSESAPQAAQAVPPQVTKPSPLLGLGPLRVIFLHLPFELFQTDW